MTLSQEPGGRSRIWIPWAVRLSFVETQYPPTSISCGLDVVERCVRNWSPSPQQHISDNAKTFHPRARATGSNSSDRRRKRSNAILLAGKFGIWDCYDHCVFYSWLHDHGLRKERVSHKLTIKRMIKRI